MNLNSFSRHIRLILRGEVLLVQARLAFAMKRSAFLGFALLFAGLGFVFINMGLFVWLSPLWGPVWTPAGLGLINLALAAAALAIAAFVKPGPEMALAEEIRNMAADSIETEIRSAPLMGGLGGGSVAGLLLPAISTIIGAMAKRRKDKA
ncbi:hypothetical protein [Aestuariivirga sp.]|uniref:hypothetical protein n=1 Tax=Aestuariivirga sp. TaxID=2650926 RepID=UPI0025C03039|nr:hypothetical protein [Aestuariivirga sp.]MCA3554070.1 hypothetical protein [Aestuariivirga sp.]